VTEADSQNGYPNFLHIRCCYDLSLKDLPLILAFGVFISISESEVVWAPAQLGIIRYEGYDGCGDYIAHDY
jgi:hypothetical protein